MLKLRPSNVTPPDKFRFLCPIDQIQIVAIGKDEWYAKIRDHYTRNGYEIPPDLFDKAEDQLCRQLSGEWCEGVGHFTNTTRFSFKDFERGMKVISSMFGHKNATVSQEIADKRAIICSRCFMQTTVPGCQTCHGVANIVAQVKGAGKTKYDHLLKVCGVCKCSNSVQIWVKHEHLAKGTDHEMLATFREIDECWKAKSIDGKTDLL
jgi:hypothetical protein